MVNVFSILTIFKGERVKLDILPAKGCGRFIDICSKSLEENNKHIVKQKYNQR